MSNIFQDSSPFAVVDNSPIIVNGVSTPNSSIQRFPNRAGAESFILQRLGAGVQPAALEVFVRVSFSISLVLGD
jgi:hypothetical protein